LPKKLRRLAFSSFFLLFLTLNYLAAAFWPVKQSLALGEWLTLQDLFPSSIYKHLVLLTEGDQLSGGVRLPGEKLRFTTPGKFQARVALHGIIPLKTLVFEVRPVPRVYPGGQAVGLLLHAKGVIVVGYADVIMADGSRVSPAAQAGIMVGDVIVKVDGRPAVSDRVVREAINHAGSQGRAVLMEVSRCGKVFRFAVHPRLCRRAGSYRVGLLIRDCTAGFGTLTFYHARSKLYGALGHIVMDATTANPVELARGSLVGAFIQGVRPGERGKPGKKSES